jgi:adenine-specific DNA-methyltransferase
MKKKETLQKLRGSYSTPYKIAEFLVHWAIKSPNDRILEPSCGEGVFLEAAYRRLRNLGAEASAIPSRVVGVEIEKKDCDKTEEKLTSILSLFAREDAQKARSGQLILTQIESASSSILNTDFFVFYNENPSPKFDVVVGNPPFIRYQNWKAESQKLAFDIMQSAGLKPNRLTNAWVPFVLASSLLLSPNGKLAMVVPAELLQVKYAAQLRMFLSNFFEAITVLTFRKLVFPAIQEEIVLLLAERSAIKGKGIGTIELEDETSLNGLSPFNSKANLKPVEHAQDKWIQYFLTVDEILFLRKIKQVALLKRLGDIASVDVGIVTGENQYFIVDAETLKRFDLSKYTLPIIGRTAYLEGTIFDIHDWKKTELLGVKCYLLALPDEPITTVDSGLLEYLKEGERKNVPKGYKCRIRKFWYSVPSIWVPDAFLFRQINSNPRLVLNDANATVTDTLHRVKFKTGTDAKTAITCFHNSLTLAFSEVLGRSYGGGVLELEPNEAEELPVPYFEIKPALIEVDRCFRQNRIDEALEIVDELTLREHLGLSRSQVETLRGIWRKLSKRRMRRKRPIASPMFPMNPNETVEVAGS